ncbi:MAG TPA: Bax inhibitor-1 family protein [Gammaproteobacteria bacterium]|nr:Bax inhibitor-1 family protein [Gammaproteobacteria bacterium]
MNTFTNSNISSFTRGAVASSHSVLRNTYFLLSLTLLFSAFTAAYSVITYAQPGIFTMILAFGLLFAVQATAESGLGIILTFAFTGVMGYTLGPILGSFFQSAMGTSIVCMSLFATSAIFLSLSSYVLISRENFNYMGGFLMAAITTCFIASIGAMVFNMPLLNLITSGGFAIISSALIMFHTSNIIHGGETNYIRATISLYVAILNLFVSLLHILSAFSGRD